MLILSIVLCVGWLLTATIGSWAYFAGETSSDQAF